MKILCLSRWGEGAYGFFRFVAEGHAVKVWTEDPVYRKEVYEGLIDKVPSWQPYVDWCDFAVFDQTGLSKIYEQIIKKKPCFGGHPLADAMEKDRKFAHEVMDYVGMKRIESHTFKTIQEAREHVKKHRVLHVVKPFGKEVNSEDIIISEDETGEDAVSLLHRFEERKIPFEGLEVEEYKEGIEVGVSGWFNGNDWVGPIEINFEGKKSAAGDHGQGIGFLTGEMTTTMRYSMNQDNKIFKETLFKLTKVLRDSDYRGQWDVNMIVDSSGIWPLENTPRWGYPSLALNMALQETPFTDLIHGIATGNIKDNKVKDEWAVGVVWVAMGFPFHDEVKKRSMNTPLFGLSEENIGHVNLYEIKAGFHDKGVPGLVTSDGMGYPAVIVGTGKTISQAQKEAYKWLDQNNEDRLRIHNSYWRIDGGERVLSQKSDIIKYGILTSKEFGA